MIFIENTLMLSVFMLTYNQVNYVEKAILSILSQKTNYSFQIVIGDDCSTDGTKEIIRAYAQKYPNIIKAIFWPKNLGLIENYIFTYKECEGKYISICDGDDYWIDNQRIQRQVDFLESNKDFGIIYGRNYNLLENQRLIQGSGNTRNEFGFNDLILKNFIPSVTVMFRKVKMHDTMKAWIKQFPYGDWPTYLLVCNNGSKIYFEDKFLAVYRRYGGVSFRLRQDHLKVIKINYQIVNCIFKDKIFKNNKKAIKKSLIEHKLAIALNYFKQRSYMLSLKWGIDPFIKNPLRVLKLYFYLMKK